MSDLPNIKWYFKNCGKFIRLVILFVFFLIQAEGYAYPDPNKDSIPTYKFLDYSFEEECDVCGCGTSGGGIGFSTVGNSNFIGLRYIAQQYRSRDGIFNNSPWVDENFNTMQLWAQIPLSSRISINAIVPYHFHNRTFANGTDQHIDGLGDISVLGFYNVITPRIDGLFPDQQYAVKHSMQLGAGLKLPTGEYQRANNTGSVNPSFQLGTGSLDVIVAGNYSATYKRWGAGVMGNYTIKTENKQEYEFGNQLNYALNIFHTFTNMKMQTFSPIIGIAGEFYGENKSYGLPVANTKGDILFSRIGIEANLGKFSAGANLMLPLSQNLNNDKVEAQHRIGVHLNFNL